MLFVVTAVASLAVAAPTQSEKASKKELAEAGRELADMYREDQDDQNRWDELGDAEAAKRQDTRRDRALELVSRGLLDEPVDFYHAAMLFQHGKGVDDFLLAHVLATVAAFDGDGGGKFLSAAALDRFLQNVGELQRFGTQFFDAQGTDLGDTSKLVSEAVVAVFRGGAPYSGSGLNGRPVDAAATSKKELKKAHKELKSLSKELKGKEGEDAVDAVRQALEIVHAGKLETGDDFYLAATILQHGQDADALLLAHVCATAAGILEEKGARELCAETLDGYLKATGRAPIFEPEEGKAVPEVLKLHPSVRARFDGKKK